MNAHSLRAMFRRRNLALFTILFLFSLVVVCGFVASRAQSDEKEEREVVEKIPKHLPIKVKVKKPERLKDAKNEEWLGELEVEVTNAGTKPIYYLYISVFLPDVIAPTGHPFGYPLKYGRSALVALDEPVRPDDVPLRPGEVVVLKVPAEQAKLWRRGRAEGDRPNPKKIELRFNYLNFGDGTGFVGGKPLPELRERGANAPCAGGDNNAGEAASVASPPQYHFPDIASLATYLPPPVNLVPAFFFSNPASPTPAMRQDLCCASGCSRLKPGTDQGCECPIGERDIVRSASCSDPAASCGSIIYESFECMVDGKKKYCERSNIDPTCAPHTPTIPPSDCTPQQEEPNPCCTPETYKLFPLETQFCRWNCEPGRCATGTTFADGCVSVVDEGMYTCAEPYVLTYKEKYGALCCPPTPTPTPSWESGPPCAEDCRAVYGPLYSCVEGLCEPHSPILVDVQGDGFSLTDAAGGVDFALTATGTRIRLAWTLFGSDDAWLALDRDGDGRIDGAHELFGNFTPQPRARAGEERHGFLALAAYDKPGAGGNSDGVINKRDAVFAYLRLWQDTNHDGVSQPAELHTLPELGLKSIDLDYKESQRTDRYGNRFRYRAQVKDVRDAQLGRWAWDVFLVGGP